MAAKPACQIAFVVFLISLLVFLVSFACPYWVWKYEPDTEVWFGLWNACVMFKDSVECAVINFHEVEDWQTTCCVLMTVALVTAVIAGCTHMYWPVTAGLQIVTGLLTISATWVYGINVADVYKRAGMTDAVPLHWAFGLAVIAGIMFLVNGLVLVACARCDMTRHIPCESSRPHDIQLPRMETPSVDVVSQFPDQLYYYAQPPPYVEQPPTYAGVYEKDDTMLVPEAHGDGK